MCTNLVINEFEGKGRGVILISSTLTHNLYFYYRKLLGHFSRFSIKNLYLRDNILNMNYPFLIKIPSDQKNFLISLIQFFINVQIKQNIISKTCAKIIIIEITTYRANNIMTSRIVMLDLLR